MPLYDMPAAPTGAQSFGKPATGQKNSPLFPGAAGSRITGPFAPPSKSSPNPQGGADSSPRGRPSGGGMPGPFASGGSVPIDPNIRAAMGALPPDGSLPQSSWHYDPLTGEWTSLAPQPDPAAALSDPSGMNTGGLPGIF